LDGVGMSGVWTIRVDRDVDGWERRLGDALVAYLVEGGDLANVRVEFLSCEGSAS
jgi:hypothetical protein